MIKNKGTIVTSAVMIFGMLSLIAMPNLAGIRQRSGVSADIRTAEQIGKAVRIWVTDVDAGKREIPTSPTLYSDIDGLTPDYIGAEWTAKTLKSGEGYYYVSSIEDGREQKITVAIAGSKEEAQKLSELDYGYDGKKAALAYIEQ